MSGSPILVLGGAGFIGGYLVRLLTAEGHTVRVLDVATPLEPAPGVSYLHGDIRDAGVLNEALAGCAMVYHLAAHLPVSRGDQASTDAEMFSINVDGTRGVLDAMEAQGIRRLVYTSSTAIFGIPERNPITEATPPSPAETYGESKTRAEALVQAFAARGNDATVIRPCPVIGQGRLGVFQILFEWIHQGYNIPVLGSGANILQFVDVTDCAQAILAAGTRPFQAGRFETCNVGADDLVALRAGLEAVIARAGSRSKVRSLPKAPIVWATLLASRLGLLPLSPFHALLYGESVHAANDAALRLLGWRPRHGFVAMLVDGYDWYLAHRETILRAKSGASAHQMAPKQGLLSLIRFLP